MFSKFKAIFAIQELRQKVFITLLLLTIYRIGYYVPLPVIDQEKMQAAMQSASKSALGQALGFVCVSQADAVIAGPEGNQEHFVRLRKAHA